MATRSKKSRGQPQGRGMAQMTGHGAGRALSASGTPHPNPTSSKGCVRMCVWDARQVLRSFFRGPFCGVAAATMFVAVSARFQRSRPSLCPVQQTRFS